MPAPAIMEASSFISNILGFFDFIRDAFGSFEFSVGTPCTMSVLIHVLVFNLNHDWAVVGEVLVGSGIIALYFFAVRDLAIPRYSCRGRNHFFHAFCGEHMIEPASPPTKIMRALRRDGEILKSWCFIPYFSFESLHFVEL